MSKAIWFVLLVGCSQIWSPICKAEWQFKKAKWLDKQYYTLFQASSDATAGFFITTKDTESIELKMMLKTSTLTLAGKEPPVSIKAEIYFDSKRYANYRLKNGLAIHQFKGLEYEFADDVFDADFYEKIKNSKQLSVHYVGLKGKTYQVEIPLEDYYVKFNQFVTSRMKEFVPAFLTRSQQKKYLNMVGSCISRAEAMVLDLNAKNSGVSLEDRKKQVLSDANKKKLNVEENELAGRVVSAYFFSGDTSKPEWLLYPMFSDCYNRGIHQFN